MRNQGTEMENDHDHDHDIERLRALALQVNRLESKVRRWLVSPWAGTYRSAFKGHGLAFEEVRAYQPGDDVRAIDWKITARRGVPFVKEFTVERERPIWLLVDASARMRLGTAGRTKWDCAVEASALWALVALRAQDRVGLQTFGDASHRAPLGRGRGHALRLVRDLLALQAAPREVHGSRSSYLALSPTDAVLRLGHAARRRAVVFVISDFLFDKPETCARLCHRLRRRHQVFALHIHDPLEREMPNLGLARWRDLVTGQEQIVDTGSSAFRWAYQRQAKERVQRLRAALAHGDIPYISLPTEAPTALSLIRHFAIPSS